MTTKEERLYGQLARSLAIISVLKELGPKSCSELHKMMRQHCAMPICSRTIRRDLNALRSVGFVGSFRSKSSQTLKWFAVPADEVNKRYSSFQGVQQVQP